jgi:Ser/Thr protein kinase RdoA (MazF antagonist)
VLTPVELVRYLIGRGLLSAESVISGDLVVRDLSSRNRNYTVELRDGMSLFVKQAADPGDNYLRREAQCYRDLSLILPDVMPKFVSWDEGMALLVVELAGNGDVHATQGAAVGENAPAIGAAMGQAIGLLHGLTMKQADGPMAEQPFMPGVLSLHRPGVSLFRDASAAAIQLTEVVQQETALRTLLDGLRNDYRITSVIHHDAKWDNFIIERNKVAVRTRLVDWELAGTGDLAWDVGSVLAGYLSSWLFSIPVTGIVPPTQFAEHAHRPISAMRPSLRAFWRTYLRSLSDILPPETQQSLLDRAMRFCAARLVQTAYEACQVADRVSSACVLHLQVAANVSRQPSMAAEGLLGLPRPSGDTNTTGA